jgi:hypothetical protein
VKIIVENMSFFGLDLIYSQNDLFSVGSPIPGFLEMELSIMILSK